MLSKIHLAARMVSFSHKAVGTVNKQVPFRNAGVQRYRLLTTATESGSVKADSAKGSSDFFKIDPTRALLFAGGLMVGGFGYLTQVISKSEERTERNMSKIEQELKQINKDFKQGIENSEQRLKQDMVKIEKSVDKLRELFVLNLINSKAPAGPQVPGNNTELES